MISKVGRFVDDDYKVMCSKWSLWRSMQLCTLFSKLRITCCTQQRKFSSWWFPHCTLGHWCIPGYFCIYFPCNIPLRLRMLFVRSSSIDFSSLWMFSDVHVDFGLPVRSWLQIVPVSLNLLTPFIINLRDGTLLTLKYFLNILCVATTELEAINSSNILTRSSILCRWFSILAEFDTSFWIILSKKIVNIFQNWYP